MDDSEWHVNDAMSIQMVLGTKIDSVLLVGSPKVAVKVLTGVYSYLEI